MTLAFSPCPNDTFIFDALVNKKIDTEGIDFEVHLADVQTLNQWAIQGKTDVTKISYGVLPLILNNYVVLESGGALGKGVGPLLIANEALEYRNLEIEIGNTKLSDMPNTQNATQNNLKIIYNEIAIPGENTTAHLLFSLAYPNAKNKKFMVFNKIEDYVLKNKQSMGVIIHENRFTYQQKGLHKIIDLGNHWEQQTNLPIPLGGIVANRKMDSLLSLQVDKLIKKSLQYAFDNYPIITNYVKQHSQEMEIAVMQQHIDLYVNNFSLGLGYNGQQAVIKLLETYNQLHSKTDIDINTVFLQSNY